MCAHVTLISNTIRCRNTGIAPLPYGSCQSDALRWGAAEVDSKASLLRVHLQTHKAVCSHGKPPADMLDDWNSVIGRIESCSRSPGSYNLDISGYPGVALVEEETA